MPFLLGFYFTRKVLKLGKKLQKMHLKWKIHAVKNAK